ncbi:hypothetical protein [Methylicorpusculum sp.]|nr:hypothetical protein [Methylicorpusculum sp.]MDO8843286.1 hypothetical protein [Methylicorpusculum sp.]
MSESHEREDGRVDSELNWVTTMKNKQNGMRINCQSKPLEE